MKSTLDRIAFGTAAVTLFAILFAAAPLYAVQTFVEDFEADPLGTLPGFDPLFNHFFTGPNAFLTDDVSFPALDQPSLHHHLFLGAGPQGIGPTTDQVTFNLPAGSVVTYAGVWMTGTGGGSAGVTFYGVNGILEFITQVQDDYEFYDTAGSGIGQILSIELNLPIFPIGPGNPGPEGLYDDIIIEVVPEPSSCLLAAVGLAGLVGLVRRRR